METSKSAPKSELELIDQSAECHKWRLQQKRSIKKIMNLLCGNLLYSNKLIGMHHAMIHKKYLKRRKPPPGWKRIVEVRDEGGQTFADVHYLSPRKILWSMAEITKYLKENLEYAGITSAQFSFEAPTDASGQTIADVYYFAPRKRLRSIAEVTKYLKENPEYAGITSAQFSFNKPRKWEAMLNDVY